MLKRTWWILLVLVIVGGLSYYFYQQVVSRTVDIWTAVPENAVMVYETRDPVRVWNEVQQKVWVKSLQGIEKVAGWNDDVELLDSLSGSAGELDMALRGRISLASFHVVKRDALGVVYYIDAGDPISSKVLTTVLSAFQKNDRYKTRNRTYQGLTIHEISSSRQSFTYLIYKGIFVGSFHPILVEDVVRNLKEGHIPFSEKVAAHKGQAKLENDEGNLYIDVNKLPDFLQVFREDPIRQKDLLSNFLSSSLLDVSFYDHELHMSGFSTIPSNKPSFMQTFKNQDPSKIDFLPLVPTSAATLTYLSFQDAFTWRQELKKFWQQTNSTKLAEIQTFEQSLGVATDDLFQWIYQQAGMITLESVAMNKPLKLAVIETSDITQALNQLNQLAETATSLTDDTLFVESYAGISIKQIPYPQIPSLLFGSLFEGFSQSFFMTTGEYVVIGNDIQAIKRFIDDMENEQVWGKTVKYNLFAEHVLQEANVAFVADINRSWWQHLQRSSPAWKEIFDEHAYLWQQFELLAAQFSYVDEKFYTSVTVRHKEKAVAPPARKRFRKEIDTYVQAPIITRPFVVRNHNDLSYETLLQDSLDHLYLVDQKGQVLWRDSIGEPIISEVYQIDFYKNGKLQYLFATPHTLQLIDRNGNDVEGYPHYMADTLSLRHLELIDYDKSKRYRFAADNRKGSIYLFNQAREQLDGWDPRKMKEPLILPLQHLRVRGRDFMIAFMENGRIAAMNRRGEIQPGFPLEIEKPLSPAFFTEIGASFTTTEISVITLDGERIKFDLEGNINSRRQLYKPSTDSRFMLVPDALGSTYVIARQDDHSIGLLDAAGELLFEKDYVTSEELEVQYYNFGAGKEIFVVTDAIQDFSYIYDRTGLLINYTPLESGFPVGMLYFEAENEFRVYHTQENNFSISVFYY